MRKSRVQWVKTNVQETPLPPPPIAPDDVKTGRGIPPKWPNESAGNTQLAVENRPHDTARVSCYICQQVKCSDGGITFVEKCLIELNFSS